MATPVLADLRYAVAELSGRLARAGGRLVEDRRTRLRAAARGLPARPEDLLALPQQRLDLAGSRLFSALQLNTIRHGQALARTTGRLNRNLLDHAIQRRDDRLEALSHRLGRWPQRIERDGERLTALARALSSLDPAKPKPGFARVEDADGRWIAQAAGLTAGQAVNLVFPDGARGARIDGDGPAPPKPRPTPKPKPTAPGQGDLF